jgi:hypothetical protein
MIEGTRRLKEAKGEYDFAVDGGAIGSITLRCGPDALGAQDQLGNTIPTGSVIEGGYIEVDTLFTTGSGATMAINAEGAGDLIAATVVSGAPYSTTGRKSLIPVFTGATTVKTTAARSLVATIAVGTVTAGKMRVVVFYR